MPPVTPPEIYAQHIRLIINAVVEVVGYFFGAISAICTMYTAFTNRRDVKALEARANRHGESIKQLLLSSTPPKTIVITAVDEIV